MFYVSSLPNFFSVFVGKRHAHHLGEAIGEAMHARGRDLHIHIDSSYIYIEVCLNSLLCGTISFVFLLFACSTRLSSNLALDEAESLVSVDVDILLVMVGIVSIAAVRVLRVAVALNDAGVGWRACEAVGTGGKLRSWLDVNTTNF